ncbi:MAG: excinuclease ABC subunit UvrA [Bacteroidia bacterium]
MLMSTLPSHTALEQLDPRYHILIKNARLHNLKGIDLAIPRNKLVVVTGLSGSGKSSLVFDTLFAEGQRRYVESLSSYARQFMGRMKKPEVDYIKGISPAMAIEQKVSVRNPRSTVGTSTEIYDYMKLLFARAGRTISPLSGMEVKKHGVEDVVQAALQLPNNSSVQLLCPLVRHDKRSLLQELKVLLQKGYIRVHCNETTYRVEDLIEDKTTQAQLETADFFIILDRLRIDATDDSLPNRLADAAQTAFYEGHGDCYLLSDSAMQHFSDRFEADGQSFEAPSVNLFSFSNPYGACKTCEGFGSIIGIDQDLVIPDKSMSIYEGAIAPWRGEKMGEWANALIKNGIRFDFPIHRPWYELSQEQQSLVWQGNQYFDGLHAFFKYLEEQSYKIQYRVMLSRYRGRTVCPDCKGTRLRKDAGYVKLVDGATGQHFSIIELVLMPVDRLLETFEKLQLADIEMQLAKRLLTEIKNRLGFLSDVGLGYLSLNRLSNSLSGGESQRIKLATSLGSNLVGSMYILDEPSIGLHPRDSQRLIKVLERLRNNGNTVIVVEHEEAVMQAADQLVDIGPLAGAHGGELVFQGSYQQLLEAQNSLTGAYLSGRESISLPENRRKWRKSIFIKGARENNLKNIDVEIPLGCLTVVSGVSGSGKTSLIKTILYPALKKLTSGFSEKTGNFDRLEGDFTSLKHIEMVDQNPIGKSSRSNPVTYTKAYDHIRALFADQQASKINGFKPAHFSFNVEGGRCEQCQGEGTVTISMQFLADITLGCDACNGHRFKDELLEVRYQGKNIYEVLEMTVTEAISFFEGQKQIQLRLQPLEDVGLGYVKLGQASSTLSGGEAQRIKLASYLTKGNQITNGLFIFDEPTTGLHFHDIKKLLYALNALIEQGNSVLVIEHNTEIIKSADWVIDLGPEGGEAGGYLVFAGTPEGLAGCVESYTGQFLAEKL